MYDSGMYSIFQGGGILFFKSMDPWEGGICPTPIHVYIIYAPPNADEVCVRLCEHYKVYNISEHNEYTFSAQTNFPPLT